MGRNGWLAESLLSLTVGSQSLDQSHQDDVDFDVTMQLGTGLQVGVQRIQMDLIGKNLMNARNIFEKLLFE